MQKRSPRAILNKAGLRATKPRLLLLELLEKTHTPLSIHDFVLKLRNNNIDQVTIYRSVETFTRVGIVREVDFQGQLARYELPDVDHDHHHIVCTKCHKIEDFIGCDVARIEKKALQQSNCFSQIIGHSFDLYGLCNMCA